MLCNLVVVRLYCPQGKRACSRLEPLRIASIEFVGPQRKMNSSTPAPPSVSYRLRRVILHVPSSQSTLPLHMRKDVSFYIDSGVYQQPTDRTKLEELIETVQVQSL